MKENKEQGLHPSGYPMKSGVDEVDVTKLSEQQFHAFDEAKMKEVESVITENQALRPLSVEESREMLRKFPDRVVRSRFHYRMKPKDSPEGISYVHKVRWVLLGFEDPDVHDMPNSSPTPALQTLNIVLAVIAGRKWKATQLDFACAFLQGKPVERLILVLQPKEGVPTLEAEQVLVMEKELYGSVAAPSWWRSSLVPDLKRWGWQRCRTDPCMFVMKAERDKSEEGMDAGMLEELMEGANTKEGPWKTEGVKMLENYEDIDGIMVLLTDDILCAGNAKHERALNWLMKKYKTGRCTSFEGAGGVFNGRRICQEADCSFKVDMHDYIKEKIRTLELPKERKREPESDATVAEKDLFRTVLMKCMWVARQARPEIIGSCALLTSKVQSPKVKDLLELGRVVAHLKREPDLAVHIQSIPFKEIRLCVTVDASPSSLTEEAQSGIIIALTNKQMAENQEAPWIPMMWRSGKIERKCSSSLAAEAFALVQGLGCAELAWTTFLEAGNAKFNPPWARTRLFAWKAGQELDYMTHVDLPASTEEGLRENLLIVDAKSLFDGVRETAGTRGRDSRITLACAEAREGLAVLGARPRWVPHNGMLVDGLTKIMSKANMGPLLLALRTGRYQLSPEWIELANRKELREKGETVPRKKSTRLSAE
eukprot:3037908-Amphidinium_carterae.2